MPISMPTGWRESALIGRQVIGVCRLYYGDESSYIPVSSSNITIGGDEHLPIMLDIPKVDYGVNYLTHAARSGNLTLRLANAGIADKLATIGSGADIGLENRKCEIKLATGGITAWANCLDHFSGTIRKIEHDADELRLEVETLDSVVYLNLPRTQVTLTDYAEAPAAAIGKYLPITIGAIDYAPGVLTDNSVDAWTSSYPVLRFDDATYATAGFDAYNTIAAAAPPTESEGPLFIWSGNQFIPARTDADKRYTHGATQRADCRIDFDSSAINFIHEMYASTASKTWDGSNGERVTDGDPSNSSISTKAASAPWTQTVNLRLDDPGSYISGKVTAVYALCRHDGSTQADCSATLKLFDADGNSVTVHNIPASTTSTFNNMHPAGIPPDGYTDIKLGDYKITGDSEFYYEFDAVSTGASDTVTLSPYELALVLIANEGDHSRPQWFVRVDGREDDGSDTYSGSANALIEVPTDAIHQIAANDLAVSDINSASFSASRTILSGWKHAYSVNAKINSRDLFNRLGYQSKSFIFFGLDRNLKSVSIADTYSSSDRVLDFEAVSNPHFSRTDLKDLATKVTVFYNQNYATGDYESQTSSTDSSQQTRYNVTEAQSSLEVEADAIRDASTAAKLRDYLLRQWKQPHNLFEGVLPLAHLDLDVGDMIEFSNVPYFVQGEDITANTTRNGQTIYKYWWIYNVTRASTSVKIKAIQMHDLS